LLGVFVLLHLPEGAVFAQKSSLYKKPPSGPKRDRTSVGGFESSQWWLGVRVGTNLSKGSPTERYSIYQSTRLDAPEDLFDKKYNAFTRTGLEFGLNITYNFMGGWSAVMQPGFIRSRYEYLNQYAWLSETNENERIFLDYTHTHTLDAIEVPLMVRYDFLSGAFVPYLQAGGYVSWVTRADQRVDVSGRDLAAGGTALFTNFTNLADVRNLYNNRNLGFIFGGGFHFTYGNARITLEGNYRLGMSNLINPANRYTNQQLNGIGDTPDDVRLRSWAFNLGIAFPLKYWITDGYKSVNPKK
jgi:hypothetical protein